MRIMLGTPCAMGMVTNQYMLSFLQTYNELTLHKQSVAQQLIAQFPGGYDAKNQQHIQALQNAMYQHTYDIGIYTVAGESLLARGRNHIASMALYGGWDKLFFIDADQGWTWPEFQAIVSSPHPIIAGVIPLKTYQYYPNSFATSLNYLPYEEDEVHFNQGMRTLESTEKMVKAHGSHILSVPFTGTGFLCIAREVLMKMAETAQEFLYPDPQTGQTIVHWSFFDGGPIADTFYSEDWQFCHRARELGYDIKIDTNVRPTHVGPHTFKAG